MTSDPTANAPAAAMRFSDYALARAEGVEPVEVRRSPEDPSLSLKDIAELMSWGGGQPTRAGVQINEQTALTFSAVFCAIRVIAEAVSMLPFRVVRQLEGGGLVEARTHQAHALIRWQPNPYMTAPTFLETFAAHVVSWGNGYAKILWDNAGRPAQILLIPPSDVRPVREGGRLFYRSTRGLGDVAAEDMLHVPGLGFDGLQGYSVIAMARESIGLGKAAEQYGANFFGSGAQMSGVLQVPGAMAPAERMKMGTEFDRLYAGINAQARTAVLTNDAKYQRIGIPPNEAQFLETRKFQKSDIATWFRVPPHMLGDLEKTTLNNLEELGTSFLTYTLAPLLNKIEAEFTRKLLGVGRDVQCDFDETLLRRANMQARKDYYASGRQWGYLTVNEIRAEEGLPPVPNGDVLLQPANMTTAGATPPNGGEVPKPAGALPAPPAAAKKPEGRAALVEQLEPVLAEIVARMNRKERNIRQRQAGEKLAGQLAEHRQHVAEAFAPLLTVLGIVGPIAGPPDEARTHESIDDAADVARLKGLLIQ